MKTLILLLILSASGLAEEKKPVDNTPPKLTDMQRAVIWQAYARAQSARATAAELLATKVQAEAALPDAQKEKEEASHSLDTIVAASCGQNFTVTGDKEGVLSCVEKRNPAPVAKPDPKKPEGAK